MKLIYCGKPNHLELSGYVDADWANDINDRRSVGGHVFLLTGGAISWSAQKQRIIAQSSTEAEYIASALAANESIWLHRLLSEIGQEQLNPTVLNTDNQASISLARNPIFHKATKHIEVRYHHMRHCFESGAIVPTYISTDNQVADILTEPLAREKHHRFSCAIGLVWTERSHQSEQAC
jgi:hypothetical protein